MICLGIESTAHTFGAGIVTSKKNILADVRDMFTTDKGGMIPNEVAEHHKHVASDVVKKAIQETKDKKIDLVSYSRGPGLGPSLHVGFNKAKEIAKELEAPLIGVNHILGHLSTTQLFTEAKDPIYVFVSGANTQVIALESGKFRIFGESLDIAIGNALDKFGRIIGLGFPAGPKIEELARKGKYIELPYVVKGMDVSFSGIVTKLESLYKKGCSKEDLCYSFQETAFAMLTEVVERAMAHCDKDEVSVIGGVAANKRFCEMLEKMCKARNGKFHAVPLRYASDNGVMIAYQGILEYMAGERTNNEIRPYERSDEIKVTWERFLKS